MRSYYVFQCIECGMWSGKEIRTDITKSKFKCNYCNHGKTIKSKLNYGLNLNFKGPFNLPRIATETCQALNQKNNKCFK